MLAQRYYERRRSADAASRSQPLLLQATLGHRWRDSLRTAHLLSQRVDLPRTTFSGGALIVQHDGDSIQ